MYAIVAVWILSTVRNFATVADTWLSKRRGEVEKKGGNY